jgi:peptide/nickel transport system ATP-binding protein
VTHNGHTPALDVHDLRVETTAGAVIVDGVSFSVDTGHVLALVGESGCGKTSTSLALLGYARPGTRIAGGSVALDGADVLGRSPAELRRLRGGSICYVPQDPVASLNPRHRIWRQVAEPLILHGRERSEAQAAVGELFERVNLPTDRAFLRRYPFELSGGQQQRLAIAMALISKPRVVVLDEPTTGLDVTTQARVLELLRELAHETKAGFVYVTHDLAVVNELADRVVVMYAGTDVETGPRERLFTGPRHPYTAMLLSSVPRVAHAQQLTGIAGTAPGPGEPRDGCPFAPRCPMVQPACRAEPPPAVMIDPEHRVRCWRAAEVVLPAAVPKAAAGALGGEPLLSVSNLTASYGRRSREHTVLHDVSFSIRAGECFALVGESGSGKSTIGRCIAGLHPHQGEVALEGTALPPSVARRTNDQRRLIQIIFQNPDRSLNPRETVQRAIWRPLHVFDGLSPKAARARTEELLERVRLRSSLRERYPSELSGGERQRVAIARALAARPRMLICDEITSSLDVSIQAAIMSLLEELRADGLALLFITHNLALVRSVATSALVLEHGYVRELGGADDVIDRAVHPYTRALLAAAPDLV